MNAKTDKKHSTMITFPCCKINLGLDIVSKRPDGYHNLETIFYPIPLEDALEITVNNKADAPEYTFKMYNAIFEDDKSDNLVVKAYKLLAANHTLPKVDISLYKHIPTGAGLGGGSSDAAFTLKMLNKIASLNLTDEQLEEYAARIGADCAFFIKNRPAFATGIGNILNPIDEYLKGYYLVLVKPDIHISTKEAYSLVTPLRPIVSLTDIISRPVNMWASSMKNDFERSMFAKYPETERIKDNLYRMGALYASMSGSGSSFFGIFENRQDEEQISSLFPDCFRMQCKL